MAELTKAKLHAQQVIERFHIDNCEVLNHLEELCWTLGAEVQFQELGGIEGRLTTSGDKGIITINCNERYDTRKRFSIGHELGHFLMHRNEKIEFNCNYRDMNEWFGRQAAEKREAEANEFSAELLMPSKLFLSEIKNKLPNFSLIEELTEKFQTSLATTAIRYAQMTDEAVAIVFYNKYGIKFHIRSEGFARQGYFINKGPISKETLAFDVVAGQRVDAMMSVGVDSWFEVKPWNQDELIKEQTRYSSGLDRGISILWIKSGKLIWN